MKATLNKPQASVSAPDSHCDWSDEQLLLAYRDSRRRELFTELVRRYESELYSYLKRYLGSTEAAEDAFQGVFLRVHLKCNQFEKGRRFRPWLYAIATNHAIDAQRRNRHHKRTVSLELVGNKAAADNDRSLTDLMTCREPTPAAQVSEVERNELLKGALHQLTDQMQLVIHLVYYQGLKYREAAEIMSIPVGTVKSRLHTAINKLSEFWKQHHSELD